MAIVPQIEQYPLIYRFLKCDFPKRDKFSFQLLEPYNGSGPNRGHRHHNQQLVGGANNGVVPSQQPQLHQRRKV